VRCRAFFRLIEQLNKSLSLQLHSQYHERSLLDAKTNQRGFFERIRRVLHQFKELRAGFEHVANTRLDFNR